MHAECTKTRPDFLLIGAAKSGTSALFHYLGQHPDVYASPVREPNFFALGRAPAAFRGPGDDAFVNRNSIASEDAYRALFAGAGDGQMAGEASALYLYHPEVPARIHEAVPGVRLIAILRDPVERAYSSYLHLVRDGREPCRRFDEALALEDERVAAGWEHLWHYTRMGFYAGQLARYLEHFDRSQLHILLYDDLKADPVAAVQSCYAFLGVPPDFTPDVRRRPNRSGVPRFRRLQHAMVATGPLRRALAALLPERVRGAAVTRAQAWNLKRPPLDGGVRRQLAALYRDDILALEKMLGRDLSGWR